MQIELKLDKRGRVTLPKALLDCAGWRPGDTLVINKETPGVAVLVKEAEGATNSELVVSQRFNK